MKNKDLEIVELYKSGLSSRKVADHVGVSNTQVNRILKRNNVKKRLVRTEKNIENNIIKRYLSGESSEKIAKDLNLNGSTICRILKRNGESIRPPEQNKRKYEIFSDYFEEIDTEKKAYLLGFLYADGNVSKSQGHICLNVHKKDEYIIKLFGDSLYINKDYCVTKYKNYLSVSVYSRKIKQDLVKHGCTPKKSFTLRVPSLPQNMVRHFIRGVFDGDGCICTSEKKKSISLIGSKLFLEDIKRILFKELGITGSFSKSKGSEQIYTLYYSRKIYLNIIINYLYKDSSVYLYRKYEKAKEIVSMIKDASPVHYSTKNIVTYNGNKLTAKYISSLSKDDKKEAANFVFEYFKMNGFPFPKYSDQELIEEFNKLKKYDVNVDNCPKSLVGQKIIHHFCEHFFNVQSPSNIGLVDAFHDDERLKSTIYNRMGISYKETFSITGNMIRQGIRNSYNGFAASFFKPIIAKFIYEKFGPKEARILDISAGFGQRMLGACAASNVEKYTGLDPWVENFNAISNIKDFFNFESVNLYNIGSESFSTDEEYNFCFSSPPFYNKEIYSSEETQAYNNRSFDEFMRYWWLPTVKIVHDRLKDGSLFIINMDQKMASLMIPYVSEYFHHESTYSLSYSRAHKGKNAIEPFFLLRKV